MDHVVTLFGGGGFVGRYVAQALYKTGVRVRIAQRDPRQAYFLKPLGGLGQTQFVAADIHDPASVAAAIRGSDAVVNLVGILKGNFTAIHVTGARNVAEAAAATGARSLVQMSAIGADPDSESAYGRSKGDAEQAARSAFPSATIIRPSIVFGREDNFVNRFAAMARLFPVLPVLRGGARFQPVYAADVGRAVAAAALDPDTHGGKIYELGGPQVMTMREIYQWICDYTRHERILAEIPDPVGGLMARVTGWLPGAPITWDQWLMLQKDNVADSRSQGLKAFGISPTPLAAVAESWLSSYRQRGRFAAKSSF